MSEELLSFGAGVGSPGWTSGIFSLKMHFLLAQPGFFPAERTESVLIFCVSRLCGLWSVAGSLLPRFAHCSELFARLRSAAAFVTTSPAEITRLRGIFGAGLAAPVGICGLFLGQGSVCFQCISLELVCLGCSLGWSHWCGWKKGVGLCFPAWSSGCHGGTGWFLFLWLVPRNGRSREQRKWCWMVPWVKGDPCGVWVVSPKLGAASPFP